MTERTVRPRRSEVVDLQSAMRDIQVSIASHHDAAAGFHSNSEGFETPARATVAFIQKVNDVLRQQIGQAEKYRRIFGQQLDAGHPGAELIEAFRYVRNVMTHQLFRATPTSTSVVGGAGIGYQTASCWDSVPRGVHNRLRDRTRPLKKYYDRHLVGQLVTDSFLDAAKYFAEICPMIVHRDQRGEWTGFPLRSQPGVAMRLHPLEPALVPGDLPSLRRNERWLNRRAPGGTFRLLCGGPPSVTGTSCSGSRSGVQPRSARSSKPPSRCPSTWRPDTHTTSPSKRAICGFNRSGRTATGKESTASSVTFLSASGSEPPSNPSARSFRTQPSWTLKTGTATSGWTSMTIWCAGPNASQPCSPRCESTRRTRTPVEP